MEIYIPSKDTLSYFHKVADPLIHQSELNRIESRVLIEIRDTLLPKLISGELDLNSINQNEPLHEAIFS